MERSRYYSRILHILFYSVWADLYRIPYEKQKLDDNMKIVPEDYYKENGGVIFPNPNVPTGL